MTDGPSEDAAQSLCKACGLCCNGVWFTTGSLQTTEVEKAQNEGFRLRDTDAGSRFTQPCPKYRNGCCSAYAEWRPSVCATYSCRLLDQLREGNISHTEAMKHAQAARAMADRVMAETGALEDGLAGQAFLQWLADEAATPVDPPKAPLSPATKMDAVALRFYYECHFKQPDKKTGAEQAPGAYLTHDPS